MFEQMKKEGRKDNCDRMTQEEHAIHHYPCHVVF